MSDDIQASATPKRLPGRPPTKSTTSAVKKGNSAWKPASLNEFTDKEPGYRYRMVRKDPDNMADKAAEFWEPVSGIQSSNTKQIDPNRIAEGKALTSVQEGKDWVLMRIPEEKAQERDAYYNAETARRTAGLTAHIKKEVGKTGAETHGEITVSSRMGTQTIE